MGVRHLGLARELFPEAQIKILTHQSGSEFPEHPDDYFFTMEDALEFSPQIAVIANPAPFHLEIAQQLVEIGTHLLIEKPISISTNGIDKLLETSKKHNTIVSIGYNLRFDPSLQELRKLLQDGQIGSALLVRSEVGQYLPTWRSGSDYRNGVSANQKLGGGVLLELSHEIDYLRWIFGDFKWVKATLSKQSTLEIDVEDSAHLTLGFLQNQEGAQLIGTLNLDFIRHDTIRICTVIGKNGSLRWDGILGKVDLFQEGSTDWVTVYERSTNLEHTYKAEWDNFLQSINGLETPKVTSVDAFKVVELIMAARMSSKSGSLVEINAPHIKDGV
jgi:predicted dehydrogenase